MTNGLSLFLSIWSEPIPCDSVHCDPRIVIPLVAGSIPPMNRIETPDCAKPRFAGLALPARTGRLTHPLDFQ